MPPTDASTEVREVFRIAHTTREGAPDGGQAQRVQLPEGLSGARRRAAADALPQQDTSHSVDPRLA